MSGGQRLMLVGLAVAVAVVAFLLLRPEEKVSERPQRTDSSGEIAGGGGSDRPQAAGEPPSGERPRAPAVEEIRVEGGQPVRGSRTIPVGKGETVRLSVRSDAPIEVHVHGYDRFAKAAPGKLARFSFPADLEGVFEVEVETTHTELARLKVSP